MEAVLRYVGEPWSESVLRPYDFQHDIVNPGGAGISSFRRYGGFESTQIGRWRRELNGSQRAFTREIADELLGTLGYESTKDDIASSTGNPPGASAEPAAKQTPGYGYFTDSDPRLIGIMMIRSENDILRESLENLTRICDRIVVLDGTEPDQEYAVSSRILGEFDEVEFVIRDRDTAGRRADLNMD